jgi:hypothetical protein
MRLAVSVYLFFASHAFAMSCIDVIRDPGTPLVDRTIHLERLPPSLLVAFSELNLRNTTVTPTALPSNEPRPVTFRSLHDWDPNFKHRWEPDFQKFSEVYGFNYVSSVVYIVYSKSRAEGARILLQTAKGGIINPQDTFYFSRGFTHETAKSLNEAERNLALRLTGEGQTFVPFPESDGRSRGRSPEGLLIPPHLPEGVRVEFKHLQPDSGGEQLFRALQHSIQARGTGQGQAPFIVADVSKTSLNEAEIFRVVRRLIGYLREHFDRGYAERVRELRVISAKSDFTYVFLTLEEAVLL